VLCWTPMHLLLFAQAMINQMIHHGFDVRGGDAVPRSSLFCEIREASAVSAHVVPKLFDDLPCAVYLHYFVPRVLE
jgi:hypothetical protein